MRYPAAIAAALIALVALPAGASAAQVEITADPSDTFSPSRVQLQPGDSAVFRNTGGNHNVRFDDGSFTFPKNALQFSSRWSSPARTFPTAGRFLFHCEIHSPGGGVGMAGEINVVPPGGTLPDTTRPKITRASLRSSRSRRLTLAFRTSEPGRFSAKFTRRVNGRNRAVRTVGRSVGKGKVTVRLKGRRAVGRYSATITMRDKAGNKSRAVKASARVR